MSFAHGTDEHGAKYILREGQIRPLEWTPGDYPSFGFNCVGFQGSLDEPSMISRLCEKGFQIGRASRASSSWALSVVFWTTEAAPQEELGVPNQSAGRNLPADMKGCGPCTLATVCSASLCISVLPWATMSFAVAKQDSLAVSLHK